MNAQAYYRSREEWNAVIEAAGFRRLKESDPASSAKAGGHYNAAIASRMTNKRSTLAYYAVYVPDLEFKIKDNDKTDSTESKGSSIFDIESQRI